MSILQWLLCGYYLIVNLLAFALFAADKRRAVRHMWRIREHTLLLTAFAGGAAGALAAMLLFRHKTRKAKFVIIVPLLTLVHFVLATVLFLRAGVSLLSLS